MNKKQIHTAAAVFLMLGFSACNMIGPEPRQVPAGPDGKAAVSVNIEAADIQSRTVLPSAALDEVTAWELWGRMWGDPEKIADFSGANATVYLEEGTWDFTLEGYTGDDLILRGSIQNQYIYLEGPNILNFTVEPVLEGNGTFKITINLPEGHGITTAKVFKEGVQIDTITPLEDAIVFENTYPAGDYYFSFRLYNNNDLYGVVSEMARVRGNLQSEKTYTLDRENLNLTYMVTYHLNDGQLGGGEANPDYYRSTDAAFNLPVPTRAGYAFLGWYTEAEFVNKVTEIAQGSTGDKIFHAKWTLVTYAITYTLNDGTNAVQNPVDYTIETPDITLADPLRTGYTFLGWYTEAGFVNAVTQIAQGSTGNKTFHAKWMPSVYTITYTLNNGTNAVQNPADYTIETPDITLADPSRTGYTFLGWYTEAGFVNKVTQIAQGSMEDKTFHAKWIGNGRDITGFRIAAAQGTISGTNITIILPYDDGAEINSLAPVISVSPSATVSPASGVTQNFNSPVMYTVTAEDGSQQMYTVTVKNSRARITAFSFVSPSATGIIIEPAKTISVPVPYGTSVAALVPAISISPGAAIDPAPGQVQNFNSPVTYTVTAENGSIAAYTVTARIPGQGVVSLVLPMDTASGALTDTPIVLSGSGVSEQTLTVSGDFDSYRWRVNGTLTGNGKSITLKAADYTAAVYQITVEVTKDGAVYSKTGFFTVQN